MSKLLQELLRLEGADPDSTAAVLAEGYAHFDTGRLEAAEGRFRAALEADPGCAEAAAALAELLALVECWDEAAGFYHLALSHGPAERRLRLGLATALSHIGQAEEALAETGRLIAERNDDPAARRLCARLLLDQGRVVEALDHAREAAFLDPRSLDGTAELAGCLLRAGDPLAAAEALGPALARAHPEDPARAGTFLALGRAWMALGERAKAIRALEAALEADPADKAGARRVLASLDAGADGELNTAYVRALFDRYAERFDADLTGRLRYAGPFLVRDALDRTGVTAGAGLKVLDVGCGTGLAGVALRDIAGHLAGIDLAPRMVERARARNVYDELHAGDLTEALGISDGWDLIVAADVLVYLGDLRPFFAAVSVALVPGGRIAATSELLEKADGWRLMPTRRYCHSEAHVRDAAAGAGLVFDLLEPAVARWEGGRPAPGLVFVARRA